MKLRSLVNSGENSEEPSSLERADPRRQPPPKNMIKMNWDAGVNVKEGRVGLGLFAKDSQGMFMAARSVTHEIQADLTTAEALATACEHHYVLQRTRF